MQRDATSLNYLIILNRKKPILHSELERGIQSYERNIRNRIPKIESRKLKLSFIKRRFWFVCHWPQVDYSLRHECYYPRQTYPQAMLAFRSSFLGYLWIWIAACIFLLYSGAIQISLNRNQHNEPFIIIRNDCLLLLVDRVINMHNLK